MTARALGPARLHSVAARAASAAPGAASADGRPPVLLVHGAYHGAWCWDGWVERLDAEGWAVHALDLRGHGGLAPDAAFRTDGAEEMTADVVAAIDAIGAPPLVVGHSMGGLLVVLAALKRPVAGLLLVCPSPPGNLPGAARVPLVDESALCPPLSAAQAGERYAPHLAPEALAAMAARLSAESPRLLNQRYDLRIPVDPAALPTDLPILVVEGGRDDPARHPPGQDEAIARFYGAGHLRLPEAPHNLMLGPGWQGWFTAIWNRVTDIL